MTTTYTAGPDKVNLARNYSLARTGGSLLDTLGISYTGSTLTPGTSAGQADRTWISLQASIAASGTLALNLTNLTGPFGESISFARMKRVYFGHTGGSASAVKIGAGGTQNPTVAPGLTQSASGGSLSDGTYKVAYTFTNTLGETMISPVTSIVVNGGGSSQKITVASITFPSGVTGINFYVSLVSTALALALQNVSPQTQGAYDITTLPTTTHAAVPQSNTASSQTLAFLDQSGATITLNNGEVLFRGTDPGATGHALTTNYPTLLVTNLDSVNAAIVDIELTGCSA